MVYKWCVVSQCKSTTTTTPRKLFVSVPTNPKRRKLWLKLAERDPNSIGPHSNVYMCEDHLDMSQQQSGNYGIMVLPENQTVNPTTTNATQNKQTYQRGQRKHRLEDLVAEYPCLWDPGDLNYTDRVLKAQCQEQLLVKYNNLSSITITMEQLKKKLDALRTRLSRRRNGRKTRGTPDNRVETPTSTAQVDKGRVGESTRRLEELAIEYPCLWDRKDPNFYKRNAKIQCLKQLLIKYNSVSSISITMDRLTNKIRSMRVWRKRQKAISQNRSANQGPSGEDSRGDSCSDVGTSSDSTGPVNKIQRIAQKNPQTGLFTIVFHCCGVCGEVKSEDLSVEDKPYVVNNKIKLTMNDLSIDLDFGKDTTVCQNCDVKLKEMYEFVKLVENAQDKMNDEYIVDETEEITIDDDDIDSDENEGQKFIIDSLTVTDTEIVKPTVVQKRKCEEIPEVKKKFKVTIDLNSCDDNTSNDRSRMDDIEAKYQIFKKGDSFDVANDTSSEESADEVSKVIVTGNSEDIDVKKEIEHDGNIVSELDIKKEIVTDDILKEVDEAIEISDDDRNDIVSEHTRVCENDDSEDIVFKEKKETISDDILKEVDKAGGIVTNEERNETTSVLTCYNGKTNEMAIISDVASNEPVCVMPKSELIRLMESIVSRMLNK